MYLWSVAIMQQNKNKKQNIMKNAINTIKKQDTSTKIGLAFVCTFILPMIIFVSYNIITGNINNF